MDNDEQYMVYSCGNDKMHACERTSLLIRTIRAEMETMTPKELDRLCAAILLMEEGEGEMTDFFPTAKA